MKRWAAYISLLGLLLAVSVAGCFQSNELNSSSESWQEYQGGPDRNQYSSLHQIDTTNVSRLEVAWKYHTGDTGEVQTNPIIINEILLFARRHENRGGNVPKQVEQAICPATQRGHISKLRHNTQI